MSWNLESNGTTKSLAEWGLSNAAITRISQAPSQLRFTGAGRSFDANPLFDYGTTIKLYYAGNIRFTGTIIQTPRQAVISENQAYLAADPWWHLEKRVFQQPWNAVVGTAIVQNYTSHILLNTVAAGLATTTDQIRSVLQYVLDQAAIEGLPAPFVIGDILPAGNGRPAAALYPPIDEIRDTTCAEVIRKQLRWHPTAVAWFDGTQDPPVFYAKERSNMVATDIDMSRHPDVTLTSLEEQIVPAVAIQYEIRNTFDGVERLHVAIDSYPPGASGRELNAMTATIDSLGVRIDTVQAEIETEAIGAESDDEAERIAWWQARKPDLAGPTYEILGIESATRKLESNSYPNELISGQIAPWMQSDEIAISAEQDTIKAFATYRVYDRDRTLPGAIVVHDLVRIPLSHPCATTDAESGIYSTLDSFEAADPIPIGLAQYLYESLQELQWSGSIRLKEQEVSGSVGMGSAINLIGTRIDALATCRALVQRIEEDIDLGQTTIFVGPPPHLSVQDLVQLLRVNRNRLRRTPRVTQIEGTLDGTGGEIRLGKETANANTTHGEGQIKRQTIYDGNNRVTLDGTTGELKIENDSTLLATLNIADLQAIPAAALPMKCRQYAVCVLVNGTKTTKTATFLASNAY